MAEHAVIIAGAGPTGLMLAAELRLAGVDAGVIERRGKPERAGHGAGGLHARTIEVFEQRGIADRFLKEGKIAQVAGFAGVHFDISDFPSPHPYGLALWQKHIERILLGWVEELGVPITRGVEVTGFAEDATGIAVQLSDGRSLRAQYLVGCDGGRSTIRKAAGIGFPGSEPTLSHIIGEVAFGEDPQWGMRTDARGLHGINKTEEGTVRVMVSEAQPGEKSEPSLSDLSEALIAHYGSDFGVHSPSFLSRFTDMARQAETYRKGRVLLAGDAAHIHYPIGGQGLNIGVQDAVNLGWKLAEVVKGVAPDSLLDTYQSERHPIAARVLRNTLAEVALARQDDRSKAARAIVSELVALDEARVRFAGMMSGLDIHYELGKGHPLLGRRIPDLELITEGGPVRVFALLQAARPLLLNFGASGEIDIAPWADRVRLVDAQYDGVWELPVIGTVPAPDAVLIRPDGYVAWLGEGTTEGLVEALTKWFGDPR
ncbi:MAG: FAD-dependent monooxygenase [Devosia sp.]